MTIEEIFFPFRRPSSTCPFDDEQWNILIQILETFVPRLTPEETSELKKDYYERVHVNPANEKDLDAYAQESLSDVPEVLQDIDCLFQNHVPPENVTQMGGLLTLLGTPHGSLNLTGSNTPFNQMTRQEREQAVLDWSTSKLVSLRALFKSFQTLAKVLWCRTSAVYHAAAGFPGYPFTEEGRKAYENIKQSAAIAEATPEFNFEDLSQADSDNGVTKLSTSILIIGSGSGGGVVAGHLSKALPNHSLMVVEKGFWYPKHKAPINERDGFHKLYEESAYLQTIDGSLGILAGKTWGGGSTVNVGVSWQLPAKTRKEWREKFGLGFVESPEFQDCLDYVCETGHAKPWKDFEHNHSNATIIQGSHRLGETFISVPQGIKGDPVSHSKICGAFCALTCKGADVSGGGGKMGVTKTYLAEAKKRGARFIQGFDVDRLTFDESGNATGVEGFWRSGPDEKNIKKVIIRAEKVICSGGSLNTPAILLRSGLSNPWIGKNLYMHPILSCMAEWKEDINPWEGSMVSAANIEHTSLDKNYGAAIEGMLMLPGQGTISIPWNNGLEYKKSMLRFKNTTNHVIIVRDRDTGRILLDEQLGKFKVDYTVSDYDRGHLLEALIATMKIHRAAGAQAIYPSVIGVPVYQRLDDEEADQIAFDEVVQRLREMGLTLENGIYGSAHQMGSCRMGISPQMGACNDKGKVWERNGLYVADASLMPTSCAVNPMTTTQALSEWVSRGIAADIKREENKN
ncbi:hypothetical protein TWF694_004423 [Orbilia ellipsospora]|uniref:Long-chain-alcohol oxidase n=1 Tax=Orbilia ellipsospora TaxID=2528407 RepID=A0AAV9WV74_9PEZI